VPEGDWYCLLCVPGAGAGAVASAGPGAVSGEALLSAVASAGAGAVSGEALVGAVSGEAFLSAVASAGAGAVSGEALVGGRIEIHWPLDEAWYEALVSAYDDATKRHEVRYRLLENGCRDSLDPEGL
jgi:hypothetical protein